MRRCWFCSKTYETIEGSEPYNYKLELDCNLDIEGVIHNICNDCISQGAEILWHKVVSIIRESVRTSILSWSPKI